jgi:hypothetical protein
MECNSSEEVRVRIAKVPRRDTCHKPVRTGEAGREGGRVLEAGALPIEYASDPRTLNQDVLWRQISVIKNGSTLGLALPLEVRFPILTVLLTRMRREPRMHVSSDTGVQPFPPSKGIPTVRPCDPELRPPFAREASQRGEQLCQLPFPGIGLAADKTSPRERPSPQLGINNEKDPTHLVPHHTVVVRNGDPHSLLEFAEEFALDFDGARHGPVTRKTRDPLSVEVEEETGPTCIDRPGSQLRQIGKVLFEEAPVRPGIGRYSRNHASATMSDLLNLPTRGTFGSSTQ